MFYLKDVCALYVEMQSGDVWRKRKRKNRMEEFVEGVYTHYIALFGKFNALFIYLPQQIRKPAQLLWIPQ